jgi:hypothetical protein
MTRAIRTPIVRFSALRSPIIVLAFEKPRSIDIVIYIVDNKNILVLNISSSKIFKDLDKVLFFFCCCTARDI